MKTRTVEVGTPARMTTPCPTCRQATLYAFPLHALTTTGVLTIGILARCLRCD